MIDIFTKQEKLSIILMLFGAIVGAGIELYRSQQKTTRHVADARHLDSLEVQVRETAAAIDSIIAKEQRATIRTVSQQHALPVSSLSQVDINRAAIEDLIQLPSIGPVIARRIVEYRESQGPFQNIDELIRVPGIGAKKLAVLQPYICIGNK